MMRPLIITILLNISFTNLFSQVAPPHAFSYSAVARDNNGLPLSNQLIGIQFSILKASTVGTVQYQENHFTTTNEFGVFTLSIGTGAVQQGALNSVNWSNDSYYLKVGLDVNGTTNFQTMGITQFLSVPYALYAETAGNNNDHDTSATNELQTLSIIGDTLSISQGNKVALSALNDGDTSSTNEIQTVSLSGDTLRISRGNEVVLKNTPLFTTKINGVSIADPSLNHAMVAPFIFLTSTGYRYDLDYEQSPHATLGFGYMSDTTALALVQGNSYGLMFTGSNCTGQSYVKAFGSNSIAKGRIFNFGATVYYVPLNAIATTISYQSVNTGGCSAVTGSEIAYPAYPNNIAVTGYPFGAERMKLTFER